MDHVSTEQLVLIIGEQHIQIRTLLVQIDQLKKELVRIQEGTSHPKTEQPE